MKVCIEPGCPVLSESTRCADHRRAQEAARGSAADRGYGSQHRRLRAAWKRRMDNGECVVCWRCKEERGVTHFVDPDSFDLGHDDHDRTKYRGPECRRGNRATSSRAPRGRGRATADNRTAGEGSEGSTRFRGFCGADVERCSA